jgi:predicted TIM-barrel fold metal-dependent hydrolase
LFPAAQGGRTLKIPAQAHRAVSRGYNTWLSEEFTTEAPDRLLGLAMLPPDVDDAIAEMRRVRNLPGIRGVVGWPAVDIGDDRFFEAALEIDMPLTAHITGQAPTVEWPPPEHVQEIVALGGPVMGPMQFIVSGIFDRLPQLRLYYAETHLGWIPYAMQELDDIYEEYGLWTGVELQHEPSWYLRNHFAWGFMTDAIGVKQRQIIGIEGCMWSTDFPHANTDWPYSRAVIEEVFAGIPSDETYQMTCRNAVRFFHLDE